MTAVTSPVVSVIVPVFDHRDELPACVRALAAQTYPSERIELLIVDNAPNGSPPIPWERTSHDGAFRASSAVLRETTPGSYAARNRALDHARGEILAFTDADCRPAADWIERAVLRFGERPECAMIAGRVEATFLDPRRPSLLELYESVTGFQQRTYLESWGFAATANMLARRTTFETVGPFDDSLKSGGDMEWGQRVRARGLVQVYADDVVVYHPARRTWRAVLARTTRIAGGIEDVSGKRGVGGWTWIDEIRKDVVPVRRIARHVADTRIGGARRKLGVAGIVWLVGIARAAERVRVRFGGSSRRT
jgi:glycosyltransferase involved in cell wall biosynthesis